MQPRPARIPAGLFPGWRNSEPPFTGFPITLNRSLHSRPRSLSDVTAQDHTITVLKRTLQSHNLPHMLFYGPPGTGKTSTVLALAKELYGPELMKTRVLELNASDERGISIVREKVKNFARTTVSTSTAQQNMEYPCPPYKIIILDEADSMTQDAQAALRRTMETYSKITRFCLICNYVTRIIEPLASRCTKFRFKPLDSENAKTRLEEIAEMEDIQLEDGVVDALIKVSDGDLRRAITYLQSAAKLHNPEKFADPDADADVDMSMDSDDTDMDVDVNMDTQDVREVEPLSEIVSVRSIQEIAGVIPDEVIDKLVKACNPKTRGGVYTGVAMMVEDLVADGWNASQAVIQVCSHDSVVHAVIY